MDNVESFVEWNHKLGPIHDSTSCSRARSRLACSEKALGNRLGVPLGWTGDSLQYISSTLFPDSSASSNQAEIWPKALFYSHKLFAFYLRNNESFDLFLDPYSSAENGIEIPPWISMLVFGITYPCLTSSFCLIHLAFLEVVKIQLGSKRLQDFRFLGGVITAHVITAETSAALRPKLAPLLIICQSFFILWGFVLSASFIYSGLKVIRYDYRVQKQLKAIELGEGASRRGMEKSNKGISKVAKVTLATSVLGFVCCGMQIYSVFGVYGLYSKAVNPSPWLWWVCQTCFRLVEFFMACTIAYSVTQSADWRG